MPKIVVENDYDGYFEGLVRSWYANLEREGIKPLRKKVVVTCGTHSLTPLIAVVLDGGETLRLDFFVSISLGYGEVTNGDLAAAVSGFL